MLLEQRMLSIENISQLHLSGPPRQNEAGEQVIFSGALMCERNSRKPWHLH